MGKLLKIVRKVLKCVVISLLFLGVALFLAIACFEQRVPHFLLERITEQLSTKEMLLSIDEAQIRFPRVISLKGIRYLNRQKIDTRPVLAASRVDVRLTLGRLPWALKHLIKEVDVYDLSYPRLPEGYYIPDSIEFPGSPDFREVNEPVVLDLPVLSAFRVRLIRPDILAIWCSEVTLSRVWSTKRAFHADNIFLKWPDLDVPMALEGKLSLDLDKQLISGEVFGQARQGNIRPMLEAIEVTNSYQFIDAFTDVTEPVDALCRFDVNLRNSDLHIFLDLHPKGGFHHGVPLQNAHGNVDIRVFVRDTYQNARIVVGPILANLGDGKRLSGSVIYENTNDIGYVTFDARSETSLSNSLAIADVLTDGSLDAVQIDQPGEITIKGPLAVNPTYAATNDLSGTFSFVRGKLFGIPLKDAFTLYALKGTDVYFRSARAMSARGGSIRGEATLNLPEFKQENSKYTVNVGVADLPMADLADVFSFNLGDRTGLVNGQITLKGPLAGDSLKRITGEGSFVCREGHLAQFSFFSGFFDTIGKLPGLSSAMRFTNDKTTISMSQMTMDFGITNGLLHISKFIVEGNAFSISGKGTYDMVADAINLNIIVKLKRDTILGALTTPLSWTLPNFLAFRVYGKLDEAQWRYTGPDWKSVITNPLK